MRNLSGPAMFGEIEHMRKDYSSCRRSFEQMRSGAVGSDPTVGDQKVPNPVLVLFGTGTDQAPRFGHPRDMPPVPDASSNTIDFLCGNCGTLLMHVREGEVHGVFIHCTECGACNTSDQ
jgi:hypothetical protein